MASPPVRVTAETHAKLTKFRLQASAEIGKDISMGDIVSATLQIAAQHHSEVIEILIRETSP